MSVGNVSNGTPPGLAFPVDVGEGVVNAGGDALHAVGEAGNDLLHGNVLGAAGDAVKGVTESAGDVLKGIGDALKEIF